MNLCRTCAASAGAEAAAPPRTATLLLRAWPESDGPRARLLGLHDPGGAEYVVAAAQGVDAICDAVRRWLLALGPEKDIQ